MYCFIKNLIQRICFTMTCVCENNDSLLLLQVIKRQGKLGFFIIICIRTCRYNISCYQSRTFEIWYTRTTQQGKLPFIPDRRQCSNAFNSIFFKLPNVFIRKLKKIFVGGQFTNVTIKNGNISCRLSQQITSYSISIYENIGNCSCPCGIKLWLCITFCNFIWFLCFYNQ